MRREFIARSFKTEEDLIESYIGETFGMTLAEQIEVGDSFRIGSSRCEEVIFKHVVGVVIDKRSSPYGDDYVNIKCVFQLEEDDDDTDEWLAMAGL